jgi:hypothetical protein
MSHYDKKNIHFGTKHELIYLLLVPVYNLSKYITQKTIKDLNFLEQLPVFS